MPFWSKKKEAKSGLDDSTAIRIVMGEQVRDVSYKELCLSNKMSIEALASLLLKKGIITTEELLNEINKLRQEGSKAAVQVKANDNGGPQHK